MQRVSGAPGAVDRAWPDAAGRARPTERPEPPERVRFEIVPLDQSLAIRGGLLRRDFGKSHGVGLADAIIAATAEELGCQLATLNRKHYPMLSAVVVPYQKE